MQAGAHRQPGSGGRSPRLDDATFRRSVDELKERIRFSDVATARMKLKRTGQEFQGLCPFHAERTPSFTINDAKGFGHCFGCGWHGDVLRFVMVTLGCGFRQAYETLDGAGLPQVAPNEMQRMRAEDRLADVAKEEEARRQWKAAVPIAGTPAETYLRARRITWTPPESAARFGVVPIWIDFEEKKRGPERPALICAATDLSGAVTGVQRIFFLRNDPTLGKADKPKRSLGCCMGAAMQLGPAAETIILPEAPEDGMSIAQEGPGHPVWVPFGTGMMPAVQFPPIVRTIIIAGQNNTASRRAVAKTEIELLERGFKVGLVWPAAQYDDWNDQLRGQA
jgi:DNA primase